MSEIPERIEFFCYLFVAICYNFNSNSFKVLNLNEKEQTLTSLLYYRLYWKDAFLTWDPDDYDGIKDSNFLLFLFFNNICNDKAVTLYSV